MGQVRVEPSTNQVRVEAVPVTEVWYFLQAMQTIREVKVKG